MGGGVYMWSSSSGDMPEISENGFDVPPAASIGSKKLKFNSGPGSVAAIEKQAKIQDSLLSAVVDSVGGHMTPADALMILNGRFSDISVKDQPKEVLKWAAQTFPKKRWAQVTSFGLSGLLITHMMKELGVLQDASIMTIDTLYLFPETYQLMQDAKDHFEISDLTVMRNKHVSSREDFERQYGSKLWKVDPPLYDYVTKVEPMRRALEQQGILAWITGRRRSQGGEREHLQLLEIDASDGRLKINPMANWEFEEVFKAVKWGNIPYNPLLDKGYTSIGDVHSTQVATPEEGERAGRWKGQNRTECGMHVSVKHESLAALAERAEKHRAGYQWEAGAQVRAQELGIVQTSEEEFKTQVMEQSKKGPVFLEVYYPTCSHCRAFEPTFNEVAAELRDGTLKAAAKVVVTRMDGYQNAIPNKFEKLFPLGGVPALFMVKDGKVSVFDKESRDKKDVVEWITKQVN